MQKIKTVSYKNYISVLSISLIIFLPIYRASYPSIYLASQLSFYLSIQLSFYLSIQLAILLSIYLASYPFIFPSIYNSIYLYSYPTIYLASYNSIYLSIFPSLYLSSYPILSIFCVTYSGELLILMVAWCSNVVSILVREINITLSGPPPPLPDNKSAADRGGSMRSQLCRLAAGELMLPAAGCKRSDSTRPSSRSFRLQE